MSSSCNPGKGGLPDLSQVTMLLAMLKESLLIIRVITTLFLTKTFFTADFPRHSVQHLASEVLTWRVVVGWGQNKNKECYKSTSFLRNIIFSFVRSSVRYSCLLCDSGRTGQKRSRQYFCMPYNAIQYNSIANTIVLSIQ